MAGRPRKILTQDEIQEVHQYLIDLDFHRVKERKCLRLLDSANRQNLSEEDLKLIRETQYLMNNAYKNYDLYNQIKAKNSHDSTEKNIIELYNKNDIDSFFTMHDLLSSLRKLKNAKIAKNKLNQKLVTQSKEKSPKKIADHKKYFLGDLIQKWIKTRYSSLDDHQFLDALKVMVENEKIGGAIRNQWTKNGQNIDWMNNRISEVKEIKDQIDFAKSDPRNPFKK